LIEAPSMNCVWVTTEAIVVNSLTTTLAGGLAPSAARNAMPSLAPPYGLATGAPPVAIRYKFEPSDALSALTTKRPSASLVTCASL